MQDPQIQLQELGITVPDAIDPKRPRCSIPTHRSFVDFETFFFADEDDKRRFDADPTGSCGILTDPVTKKRFRPGSESPRSSYAGRLYVFLDDASREEFESTPDELRASELRQARDPRDADDADSSRPDRATRPCRTRRARCDRVCISRRNDGASGVSA